MLKWNFDVERVDVILGHNFEYTGSVSRLPHFGARMLKRKPPGEEGMPNRTEIWLFHEVTADEIG